MQDVKLKEADITDIDRITELAKLVWNQHYPAIIGQDQVDYMLAMMYSKTSLEEQMKGKGHRFFFVLMDGKEVGFISMNRVSGDDWFLNKFYIDQNVGAKGIGTMAFGSITEILHPTKITLTVNRGNFKTINFYFKLGFTIDHCAQFDIGKGYVMDDFVMVWKC